MWIIVNYIIYYGPLKSYETIAADEDVYKYFLFITLTNNS